MEILLSEVETVYRKELQKLTERDEPLTASSIIELTDRLFRTFKIKNISDLDDEDSDMLLYQYGIYSCGKELGKCFVFDITRQFMEPEEDEPYQLSISLLYDPEPFKNIDSLDCWNYEFPNLEKFFSYIKSTDGFKLADEGKPKTYQIGFYQC